MKRIQLQKSVKISLISRIREPFEEFMRTTHISTLQQDPI